MPDSRDRGSSIPDPNAFEGGKCDVDDELRVRNAFVAALAGNGFPDTLVLDRDRAGAVFHDRCLKILDHFREHDPESVRALAEDLDYDKGVVSRDLQELARIDVGEYQDAGRGKAPRLKHRHVTVDPVV